MTDRIIIACPHCQHGLRVRGEYFGRKIQCNFCRKLFLAQSPESPTVLDSAGPAESPTVLDSAGPAESPTVLDSTGPAESPSDSHATPGRPPATAEAELEWARGKITRLRAQRQAFARELLKARNDLGPLQLRVTDLEKQLEQARDEVLHVREELRTRELGLSELERLRAEAATLGTRAAEAVRLEEELQQAQDESRRLELELEESRSRPSVAEGPSGAAIGDLAPSVQDRSDRLAEEPDSVRTALDAERAGRADEVGRLTEERDRAIRDRDRLEEELESLRAGFKDAREEINRMGQGLEQVAVEGARLEEERQAVSRMRDELQSMIGDRERSLAERDAELREIRAALDRDQSLLELRLGPESGRVAAELATAMEEVSALRAERDESTRKWREVLRELEELKALRGAESERDEETSRSLKAEIARLEAERASMHEDGESQLLRLRDEMGRELRTLQAELHRRQGEDEAKERGRQHEIEEAVNRRLDAAAADAGRQVESLRGELESTRRAMDGLRAERDRLALLHEQIQSRISQEEQRHREDLARLAGELADSSRQAELKDGQVADLNRRVKSLQDEARAAPRTNERPAPFPSRPQAGPGDDPARIRAALEAWLERANTELASTTARVGALTVEVAAAREELELLHTDLALGDWEEEIAFPFEEG